MSAVLQSLTEDFGVEWLESSVPPTWTRDGKRAHVFPDQEAESAARQIALLTRRRVLPVTRATEPRRSFLPKRARSDWREGKINCGVE